MWSVEQGYDLAADDYDQWYWREFWQANEVPLICRDLPLSGGGLALDAGTGTGAYLAHLEERGYVSVGVDKSRNMLRHARMNAPRARLLRASIDRMPMRLAAVDVVLLCRVISHVERIGDLFVELARVSRQGARLLFTSVSPTHNYVRTRIPTSLGDVHIETFKHSRGDVISKATSTGLWRVRSQYDVRSSDLFVVPPAGSYPAVDLDAEEPIFFGGVLERSAAPARTVEAG